MLARAWRISPAQLRDCTVAETEAMWRVLEYENEMRNRRG